MAGRRQTDVVDFCPRVHAFTYAVDQWNQEVCKLCAIPRHSYLC